MPTLLNSHDVNRIHAIIKKWAGLNLPQWNRDAFQDAIKQRMQRLKLKSIYAYTERLENNAGRELEALASLITTTETYFFRDTGQMQLLRRHILPELIKINQSSKRLTVWSAGCATGEEPFSIAIQLAELLPDRADWQIHICGSDINRRALNKARAGLFGAWSFRQVDNAVRNRWFRPKGDVWQIDPQIRRMVDFSPSNLARDGVPERLRSAPGIDLILCRNVFIYLDQAVSQTVLSQFTNALIDGGYLLTGHCEIERLNVRPLTPRIVDNIRVYRHPIPSEVTPGVSLPPSVGASPHTSRPTISRSLSGTCAPKFITALGAQANLKLAPARHADTELHQKQHSRSPIQRQSDFTTRTDPPAALIARAQELVKSGKQNEALATLEEAMHLDRLAQAPYFLMACLNEEMGRIDDAQKLLKKVLYLAPGSIRAYLELAALYSRRGRYDPARRLYQTALNILDDPTAPEPEDTYGFASAVELRTYLKTLVDGPLRRHSGE